MQCAIYVQNRYPHAKLDDKKPQEGWSGQKPTISHLKVFGSVACAHIPDQQRTKLEDKSKRYIFIGYDEKTKGSKLLDLISKMVIVSCDVRVNEASEWDWKNSTEVNIEVGESSVTAPTSAPTDSEIFDDEDEPRQPKMRCLRDLMTQQRNSLDVNMNQVQQEAVNLQHTIEKLTHDKTKLEETRMLAVNVAVDLRRKLNKLNEAMKSESSVAEC